MQLVALATAITCTPFEDAAGGPGPSREDMADGAAHGAPGGTAPTDPDAGPPCDPTQPFGPPTPVPGLTDVMATALAGLRLSPDYLTGYFQASGRPDSDGNYDLYTATRSATGADSPFGNVTPIAGTGINSQWDELDPTASSDGLTLVFAAAVPLDPVHLYVATRADVSMPFTNVEIMQAVDDPSASFDTTPFLRDDGHAIYFASDRVTANNTDIYRATSTGSGFGVPLAVQELNTSFSEQNPVVTPDDLLIYYASDRPDGKGNDDIWEATRTSPSDTFSAPTNVSELNSTDYEVPTFITRDGCTIYLASTRDGTLSEYVSTRLGQ